MNELAWIGAAVGGVLVAATAVVAAWRQHLRQSELLQRLARLELARGTMERHARDIDERLHALGSALERLRAAPPVDDVSTRRRLLEETLARADAAAAATLAAAPQASGWPDTEPLALAEASYAPTLPMDLLPEPQASPPTAARSSVTAGARSLVRP